MLKMKVPVPRMVDTAREVDFEYGQVQESAGRAALGALKQAVKLIKSGEIDALVTAPVSKQAIQFVHKEFSGHTELLASEFGAGEVLMVAHSPYISFAFVTTHHPLAVVSPMITASRVLNKLELYRDFLRTLHSREPHITVLGLNPHGMEFSHGEEEEINQAVRTARNRGLYVDGPYPADTFYYYREETDGFLVQYHDQGMIPAKLLARGQGVNVTWGLPFVRTSPLHGTAFDIAGKGDADPESMIAAIRMAEALSRN